MLADVFQIISNLPKVESKKFAPMANSHGKRIEFNVVVPADYDHRKAIAQFVESNDLTCRYCNPGQIDNNFSNPSRVLKAGDRLLMGAFEQIEPGTTTSDERLDFQRALPGNVFVGAQGLPFIFEKRAELPNCKWFYSYDEKENLPFFEVDHRVPYIRAGTGRAFNAFFGAFEGVLSQDNAFFCFRDESLIA
jgi:hypothetical protein